jgi:hypothetical protein
MPYAKCTIMGSPIDLILTPNHSAACEVMNELVVSEWKRQHTNSLFILHFNFSKWVASLLWATILAMKPPWKISLPWEM